ncbi:MAG: hypothetical protein IKP95_12970 [Ruminococcus sp.]|nr:hypothetical protein [Ruminococcus sp.]MBR6103333.1 hypothetical protein [Ruminococcus sp.]
MNNYKSGYEAGQRAEQEKTAGLVTMLQLKVLDLQRKVEELENKNAANEKRIAEVVEDILSRKDDPELEEFRKNCVMINFLANQMQSEKPYYSILYYDKRDNNYYDGFGSYDHEIVNAYKEAYFDHWDEDYFEKQIDELKDKEV